jgi:branched-chain amino acid transport system substrate-binding protein
MDTEKTTRALRRLTSALVLWVVCASLAAAQTAAPIRIGLLTVKTGPLATGGIQMEQGLTVYLEEHGFTMAGRPVELVVADTGGSPATAKTKAQELVERERVDAIIGPLAAYEALAINDYIADVGVPTLSIAAAEDMTQRAPNPFFIRASSSSAQAAHAMGDYAAVDRGLRTAVTIGDDIAYGQEMVAGFQRVFEEQGGQVVLKLWPPLNVAEYSAYIAQIRNVDVVYMAFAGANGLRFMRQYEEFGLQGSIPLLGGMTSADESLLRNMSTEALGVITSSFYSAELDNPSNRRFVARMQEKYGVAPGYYAVSAYLEAMVLAAGLERVDGRTDDKAALMSAMRSLTLAETPRGVLRFDEYGNVVGNIYILEVQRRDGQLVNTPIKTYENVSQFWTYDPEAFLAQPVYSRDYPPARYLR